MVSEQFESMSGESRWSSYCVYEAMAGDTIPQKVDLTKKKVIPLKIMLSDFQQQIQNQMAILNQKVNELVIENAKTHSIIRETHSILREEVRTTVAQSVFYPAPLPMPKPCASPRLLSDSGGFTSNCEEFSRRKTIDLKFSKPTHDLSYASIRDITITKNGVEEKDLSIEGKRKLIKGEGSVDSMFVSGGFDSMKKQLANNPEPGIRVFRPDLDLDPSAVYSSSSHIRSQGDSSTVSIRSERREVIEAVYSAHSSSITVVEDKGDQNWPNQRKARATAQNSLGPVVSHTRMNRLSPHVEIVGPTMNEQIPSTNIQEIAILTRKRSRAVSLGASLFPHFVKPDNNINQSLTLPGLRFRPNPYPKSSLNSTTTDFITGPNLDPKPALNSNSKPDPKPPDYLLLRSQTPSSLHLWIIPSLTEVDSEGGSYSLTCTKLQYRRAQGLCCHDEKYKLGCKCKDDKMKGLVAMYEDKDTDKELEFNRDLLDGSGAANVQTKIKVYLFVKGLINPKTMKLVGTGEFIGSGSIHKLILIKAVENKMGESRIFYNGNYVDFAIMFLISMVVVACLFPITVVMATAIETKCVALNNTAITTTKVFVTLVNESINYSLMLAVADVGKPIGREICVTIETNNLEEAITTIDLLRQTVDRVNLSVIPTKWFVSRSDDKITLVWQLIYLENTWPCPGQTEASYGATVFMHEAICEDALTKSIAISHIWTEKLSKVEDSTGSVHARMSNNLADLQGLHIIFSDLQQLFKNGLMVNKYEDVKSRSRQENMVESVSRQNSINNRFAITIMVSILAWKCLNGWPGLIEFIRKVVKVKLAADLFGFKMTQDEEDDLLWGSADYSKHETKLLECFPVTGLGLKVENTHIQWYVAENMSDRIAEVLVTLTVALKRKCDIMASHSKIGNDIMWSFCEGEMEQDWKDWTSMAAGLGELAIGQQQFLYFFYPP